MALETGSSPVVPHAIVQAEGDNILWSQLVTELSRHYEGSLTVVFPAALDERTYSWFRTIEDYNFRSELRYTFDELKTILGRPELLFFFVFKGELPEIVVLGYAKPGEPERVFRLDTFAINKRGKGIGHIVMDFLIKWARAKQYVAIELDTEETDEKGIRLQRFYEKHKFLVVSRDVKGDITMRCVLVETSVSQPAGGPQAGPAPVQTPPADTPPAPAPPTGSSPAPAPAPSTPPVSNPPTETPPPSPESPAAVSVPAVSTAEPPPPPIAALVTTAVILAATTPSSATPEAKPTTRMAPQAESQDGPAT